MELYLIYQDLKLLNLIILMRLKCFINRLLKFYRIFNNKLYLKKNKNLILKMNNFLEKY